ncbi:MAG: LPS export ABC transporter periplasmic protein LptC [Gemmatimonadales bacterium]
MPLCLCAFLVLCGCSGGGKSVSATGAQPDSADQVMFGVRQRLTNNGVQQAYLKADSALIYETPGRVDLRKVTVTFFSPEGLQLSVLTSQTGVYWMRTNQMSASGNVVVVRTSDGARLQTDFLEYDPAKSEVTTNRPFVADKAAQHIEGDKGFTCDPGFTNCTVVGARGTAGRLVMPGP